MNCRCVTLVFLMLCSAHSNAFSGLEFVEKCSGLADSTANESAQKALDQALDAGSCTGFVGGVIKGVNLVGSMLQAQNAAKKNFICLPDNLHSLALLNQSVAYIKQDPNVQKLPAQAGIYTAMIQKYPCPD